MMNGVATGVEIAMVTYGRQMNMVAHTTMLVMVLTLTQQTTMKTEITLVRTPMDFTGKETSMVIIIKGIIMMRPTTNIK